MKKVFYLVFILLFCFDSVFAQSCLPKAINLALAICVGLVSLLFIFGYLFKFDQLTFLAKKELAELIIVATFLFLFSFFQEELSKNLVLIFNFDKKSWDQPSGIRNSVFKDLGFNSSSKFKIQEKALILVEENKKFLLDLNKGTISFANAIGYSSSKTSFINFLSTGFGYSACSTYSLFRGPVNLLLNAQATAYFALFFTQFFSSFFESYLLCYFLPIGIFLRLLSFTKKAGSLLIALSISFYFVFPTAVVIFNDLYNFYYPTLINEKQTSISSLDLQINHLNNIFSHNISCDDDIEKIDETISTLLIELIDVKLPKVLAFVILKCIFILLLCLSVTIAFTSSFSHILGLEIDLSTLARLS